MAVVSDPVGMGFVDSLARPGGNITGVSNTGDQLLGKRLQLLREIAPDIRKVGLLWNVTDPQQENLAADFKQAAEHLGLSPSHLPVKTPADLDHIDGLAAGKIDGLIVASGGHHVWLQKADDRVHDPKSNSGSIHVQGRSRGWRAPQLWVEPSGFVPPRRVLC